MSARFPLQPVMDIARESADTAASKLGHATHQAVCADQQLQTLLAYRDEHQARFMATLTGGTDSTAWRNYQLFMAKLDAGIGLARAHADATRAALERAQDHWQAQQRKLKAYDVLAKRHDRTQQQYASRREQRETDEYATNKFKRASVAKTPR